MAAYVKYLEVEIESWVYRNLAGYINIKGVLNQLRRSKNVVIGPKMVKLGPSTAQNEVFDDGVVSQGDLIKKIHGDGWDS